MALFEAILADFSYSYFLTFWVGNVSYKEEKIFLIINW